MTLSRCLIDKKINIKTKALIINNKIIDTNLNIPIIKIINQILNKSFKILKNPPNTIINLSEDTRAIEGYSFNLGTIQIELKKKTP